MDILNFISWIKGKGYATTADRKKTLIPLGLKDERRDDQYLPGAMTVENFEPTVNGYKEYTVLITQRGINDPTVVVLKNTLDVNPTFFYAGVGGYAVTFDKNIFDSPNEYITISSGFTDPISGDLITIEAYAVFPPAMFIQSFLNGVPADNVIGADLSFGFPCVLTIRKYN